MSPAWNGERKRWNRVIERLMEGTDRYTRRDHPASNPVPERTAGWTLDAPTPLSFSVCASATTDQQGSMAVQAMPQLPQSV
jgi:hypothetical protein